MLLRQAMPPLALPTHAAAAAMSPMPTLPAIPTVAAVTATAPAPEGKPINLRVLEADAIERALVATGGHRTRAAELLGISERTLRNKLNGAPA
jgi:two-component system response regulator FlrC